MGPRGLAALVGAALVAGCAAQAPEPEPERPAPRERSGMIVPGRSAEAFDTVTPEERRAATTPDSAPEQALGSTVASLGPAGEEGLWMRTALVSETRPGRVELADGEGSVQLELRPGTGGSRLSLSAMRSLGVALTALPRVEVFAR